MDNSNTSEEREFWLRWQTWPDVKHYIDAHTAHSYVHPYGFTVVRLQLPGSEPWLARVHFWDEKSPETSDLLIHRHGDWALMSKVLVGSIRESEYTFEPSEEGPYYEYAVSKSADNRQSSLVETGKRAYLRSARSQIRCVTSPVMHIPPSSFHSTENSADSSGRRNTLMMEVCGGDASAEAGGPCGRGIGRPAAAVGGGSGIAARDALAWAS